MRGGGARMQAACQPIPASHASDAGCIAAYASYGRGGPAAWYLGGARLVTEGPAYAGGYTGVTPTHGGYAFVGIDVSSVPHVAKLQLKGLV